MAKAKSQALVKWDEKFAQKAAEQAAAEPLGGGNRFSIKGGQLSYKGVNIPGNEAEVVIVASTFDNQYRKGSYDPNNYEAPVCFASAKTEKELKPHPDSTEPQVKAGQTCAQCPHNEYGSANVGAGKACRQARNLALITIEDAENIETAELATVSIPPTSLKGWKGYIQMLSTTLGRPAMSVVTKIKALMVGTYPACETTLVSKIDDGEVLDAIEAREEEAYKMLMAPHKPAEAKTVKKAPAFAGKKKFGK